MKTINTVYDQVDAKITNWMARFSIVILRVSVGFIFLWFGLLKFCPYMSMEQDLAVRTIGLVSLGMVPSNVAIFMAASCECFVGIGLITGKFMRLILILLVAHMFCTLIPLVMFHQEMFTIFPYVPSLKGQYILKNIILISVGLVLGATVRGGILVAEPALISQTQKRIVPKNTNMMPAEAIP